MEICCLNCLSTKFSIISTNFEINLYITWHAQQEISHSVNSNWSAMEILNKHLVQWKRNNIHQGLFSRAAILYLMCIQYVGVLCSIMEYDNLWKPKSSICFEVLLSKIFKKIFSKHYISTSVIHIGNVFHSNHIYIYTQWQFTVLC